MRCGFAADQLDLPVLISAQRQLGLGFNKISQQLGFEF
jgi:hypothetical protein